MSTEGCRAAKMGSLEWSIKVRPLSFGWQGLGLPSSRRTSSVGLHYSQSLDRRRWKYDLEIFFLVWPGILGPVYAPAVILRGSPRIEPRNMTVTMGLIERTSLLKAQTRKLWDELDHRISERDNYPKSRVGKRTVQELRKVGGNAADVRRRYNLFPSKQPTARLRMGKVVLEWNPIPAPIYKPLKPPPTGKVTVPSTGLDDLLSQVASASGYDIEKPNSSNENTCENDNQNLEQNNGFETKNLERNPNEILTVHESKSSYDSKYPYGNKSSYEVKNLNNQENIAAENISPLPEYRECVAQPTAYINLAYEHDLDTKPDMQLKVKEYSSFQSPNNLNYGNNISKPVHEPVTQTHASHYGTLPPVDIPQTTSFMRQSSNADQLNEERGISVNVQTKIISTKITKVRTPRNKDMPVLLKRREYSGSSSDEERKIKTGKKKMGKVCNLPYRVKHKRRRKRNQISYEEKISLDHVPCNFPISMETTIHKTHVDTPEKLDENPFFEPKSEDEPMN
ncbi:uncharacterized protein TNCV_3465931 [Trichonephila clavipes]|nr:uncharacterized protein TNCV_3465931 [Trichonephila clavipes]